VPSIILLSPLLFTILFAQPPPEWQIDPSEYEYFMTITAVVQNNGSPTGSESDALAAFVDEECRGVVLPILAGDTWIYFLMVYSNNSSGDDVHFQAFLNGQVFEISETAEFSAGFSLGEPDVPYALNASGGPSPVTLEVSYNDDWNMVGLPLLGESVNYIDLFPTALPGALYFFDGIYQTGYEMEPGTGYLLRLTESGITSFIGYAISSVTITLSSDWNIISGISEEIDAQTLYDSGLVSSGTVYGFDGIYQSADVLEPGRGYWVRSPEGGELTIGGSE